MNISDSRIDLSIKNTQKPTQTRKGQISMSGWGLPSRSHLSPSCCWSQRQASGILVAAHEVALWKKTFVAPLPLCNRHSGYARPFKHPNFHLCLKQNEETLLMAIICQATIKKSFKTTLFRSILILPGFISNFLYNPNYLLWALLDWQLWIKFFGRE